MNAAKTLFILWLAHFFMDFFTGIWPIYKTIASIDIAQAGIIIGISGFLGEILQLLFGYFCDRGHRKKVLLFGLLLASTILWITFSSKIFPCFCILTIMMIGSGAFHPSATGMASSLSPNHKAKTVLIFASGGALGLGISQLTFIKLSHLFEGHILILFVPFLLMIGFLLLHRFPTQEVMHSRFSLKAFLTPMMNYKKPLLLLYVSQVATQALTLGIYFLLPDLLQTKNCSSWICLGGGHFCFVLGAAATMIPIGYLCDKFGQKSILLIVLTCSICLFYLFLGKQNLPFWGTIALLTALGACMGTINPIIVSWGNQLVPESPSTVSALLMGCAWCIGNLGPIATGLFTQVFTENPYTKTLSFSGLLLIVVFCCISLMPRIEKIRSDQIPAGESK